MQTANEIIIDIINSSSTTYTQQQIETEFANEINLFNNQQLTEIDLYEIISTAIDNRNF